MNWQFLEIMQSQLEAFFEIIDRLLEFSKRYARFSKIDQTIRDIIVLCLTFVIDLSILKTNLQIIEMIWVVLVNTLSHLKALCVEFQCSLQVGILLMCKANIEQATCYILMILHVLMNSTKHF